MRWNAEWEQEGKMMLSDGGACKIGGNAETKTVIAGARGARVVSIFRTLIS